MAEEKGTRVTERAILHYFPWGEYRIYAAEYYDALYEFNKREANKRQERVSEQEDEGVESQEKARERLLFGRATMQKMQEQKSSILYEREEIESPSSDVDPDSVAPGVVPIRLGGKRPSVFLLYSRVS